MRIIGGIYRNRPLRTPRGLDVRPTAAAFRKAIFDICQQVVEEATVLDLFAGSGALGLEALSRGAAFLTSIDNSRPSLDCIKHNIKTLGVEKQTQILKGDVFRLIENLSKQGKRYDLIVADPPYHTFQGESQKLLAQSLVEKVDKLPLLDDEGLFFVECDAKTPLNEIKLTSLHLKNARVIGRSMLYQYEKAS